MYHYEHRQAGTLIRLVLGLMVIGFASVAMILLSKNEIEGAIGFGASTLICVVFLALFHSLTVRVCSREVQLAFGFNLINKSISIDDIDSVSVVKNHWYHGWGIKKIRNGWLYNVSGFDAVELRLKDQRVYRIGTDEPRRLLAVIDTEIKV